MDDRSADARWRGLYRAGGVAALIAAALGFSGVVSYFATNQAFTMMSLGRQFAAAAEPQRSLLQAAGQAVLAVSHGKDAALFGILANAFGLAYYPVLAAARGFVALPISLSSVFLLIWYILLGQRLLRRGHVTK